LSVFLGGQTGNSQRLTSGLAAGAAMRITDLAPMKIAPARSMLLVPKYVLNLVAVDIPVTFTPVVQKRIGQFQNIAITLDVATSNFTRFLQSVAISVTLSPSVQKLIKQNQSIPVTLTPSVQKKVSKTIAITVNLAVTISTSFRTFVTVDIPVTFSLFVDALKGFAGAATGGSKRRRWRR
jgi:hypothetical protein